MRDGVNHAMVAARVRDCTSGNARRDVLIEELFGMDGEELFSSLSGIVGGGDPDAAAEALDLMSIVIPDRAMPLVEESLSHPERLMRYIACYILVYDEARGETSSLEPLLADLLRRETDGDTRYMAVMALAVHGTDASRGLLREISERDGTYDYEGRPVADLARRALAGPGDAGT